MDNINLFPLFLSFRVAFTATFIGIVCGLPLAYLLSRRPGRLSDFIDTLTNLPVVLPPTVLGYYLLVLLGRNSWPGKFLEEQFNIMIVFTTTGAVIAATVVSIPYMIKASKAALSEINEDYLNAARLLGRTELNIFVTIMVPIAWRGIISGITMSFARALGDFGTTLMVAGSIPDKTLTMPIAIYDSLQAGNYNMANFLVLIMTSVAVAVLYIVNRLEKKMKKG
ncbi:MULTISPECIES: molybdate ABC transporter permease subunit [Dehalobacter]|jgi:molybdate transport system permease protein|uniref:Molybdenum transport system permease n=2 Tax=Dehalobacter restrictus TaxID=55583 RepID=A0A857DG24_9FIRM|nr:MULTISPECIES: molybdate ABC transporter permease subunit [Dehalobacter]AHF08931.1 molybdate ABC transporter permease [Dehalobacter restrictus DSM 9455]MCG1026059.1 molybdate ABC transporter permease subunit [Dehalobacter sp.]MDJ0306677.1 molybdate ABC transporter permease subunit [Dehalobacter sp.]OCZ50911.1 molybdenum ABC transporter permease subunit [Dehalobacter sp. TeCB1]QGZ99451.1 molybdate ABC transporter permease subunit [Dehalobacter restrictus]